MFQQILQVLRNLLAPYDDAIADLVARIEELERRQDNLIQVGVIAEVNESGDQVRVTFAANKTPWIKPLFSRAGAIREKSRISVGEQVLLLNWAGGDNSSQSFALCGIYSSKYQPPTSNPDEHVIDWGDGLKLVVNTKEKTVHWTAKKVTFDTDEVHSTGELSDSVRAVSSDRVIFNGHDHIGNAGQPTSPSNQSQ